MKTTKLKSDGDVLRTAVAQIDDSSATALVIADAHATSVFGERVRHFRWEVSLVRDPDDANRWLVDDFEAVAMMSDQALGAASAVPATEDRR